MVDSEIKDDVKENNEAPDADKLANGASSYDFAAQDRIVRGRMPTLELVNERFARNLRVSFFNFLRRTPEVMVEPIKVMKYNEYLHKLVLPASLNTIRIQPLRGNALLILDARLVFVLVESFFGGEGKFESDIQERDFTPTEIRIIEMTIQSIFKDLTEAWMLITPVSFEHLGMEVNPAMANFITPNEVVVVNSFKVTFDGGEGEIHLTIPYSMLEPIRDTLHSGVRSDYEDRDERWVQCIKREILSAPITIESALCKKSTNFREIMDFDEGTIIPIEMPETVSLYADGVPTFKCKLGTSGGHYALKIINNLTHEL